MGDTDKSQCRTDTGARISLDKNIIFQIFPGLPVKTATPACLPEWIAVATSSVTSWLQDVTVHI